MSQRDNFGSGFLAGALIGSVVGGILGTLITQRRDGQFAAEDTEDIERRIEAKKASAKRRQIASSETESVDMETARRSLEDKIAQLNDTIDEVRQQLGNVNGTAPGVISDR